MSTAGAQPQRVVVKVGSSVLTDEGGRVVPARVRELSGQLAKLIRAHRQVVLVSSGAIACGMELWGLKRRPAALPQLQACAALGQSRLMRLYSEAFASHELLVAQVLLTQDDLAQRGRRANARAALVALLQRGVVPIVNENDTVAVEEITFGDNDRLAALVAPVVGAQLVILLSDVEGFLKDGQLIERLSASGAVDHGACHDPSTRHAHDAAGSGFRPGGLHGRKRQVTKGGMVSKLEAARIAGHCGIPTVIASGLRPGVLEDLLAGKPVGTLCVPPDSRLSGRKWWMAFALRRPHGELVIDPGATHAVAEQGRSVLASGILKVRGRFAAGACVSIVTADRRELARGVTNFSSAELARVRGLKSAEIAKLLGPTRGREAVHRDHLVLAREWRP